MFTKNLIPTARRIQRNLADDGIDRRGFLECMAWAGTGVLWTVGGGILRGQQAASDSPGRSPGLTFAQISDSHIGFAQAANQDVAGTLQEAVNRINALPVPPAFVLHTGDISHLSKPAQFDNAAQILKGLKAGQVFYVPGEHDVLTAAGKTYLEHFGQGTQGAGWYSFDRQGVHFIGLVNSLHIQPGGFGSLGPEQLAWLKQDLEGLSSSTPIVLFAHMPLWSIYPEWGWGTTDAEQALSYLRRFGSVTVLNGHIHQVMQKIEGHLAFHTAASTAFPQPKPGTAPAPGPMTVPAGQLRGLLGITRASYVPAQGSLAIIDTPLDAEMATSSDSETDGRNHRPGGSI